MKNRVYDGNEMFSSVLVFITLFGGFYERKVLSTYQKGPRINWKFIFDKLRMFIYCRLYSQWTELLPDELRGNSTFLEFYALVSTIFTWKKKFSGKSVLVWSDSSGVVFIVNKGLKWKPQSKKINLFGRPFKVYFLYTFFVDLVYWQYQIY